MGNCTSEEEYSDEEYTSRGIDRSDFFSSARDCQEDSIKDKAHDDLEDELKHFRLKRAHGFISERDFKLINEKVKEKKKTISIQ